MCRTVDASNLHHGSDAFFTITRGWAMAEVWRGSRSGKKLLSGTRSLVFLWEESLEGLPRQLALSYRQVPMSSAYACVN